jgi:hypothetical protein
MDEKELPEGIRWEELARIVKDKAKVKVEVENNEKNDDEVKLYSPYDSRLAPYERVNDVTWIDLVLALLEERSFSSLRRELGKKTSIIKVPTSKKVLDCFLKRAWDKPILKSKNEMIRFSHL